MKVALIGAAGSGKSKIGRRIVNRLRPISANWTPQADWKLIDGYVQRLEERTQMKYDIESDYLQNLEVLTTRTMLEAEAYKNGKHTITCGTIYETIIHAAIFTLKIRYLRDEQQIALESHAAQLFMGTLGMIENRYFDYDVLFYLPLKDDTRTWEHAVDAKIPEVLEGSFKTAVVLDDATDRKKVDHAVQIIREVGASLPTSSVDEQRSGSDSSDSEREERQSE